MFQSERRRQKSTKKGRAKKGRPTTANENLPDKIAKNGAGRKRIAAGRITVPLGFFGQGVKSKIVRKKPEGCVLSRESRDFLNEDLHALLQSVPPTNVLRRSERISARSCNNVAPNQVNSIRGSNARAYYDSAADYYVNCQSEAPQKSHPPKSLFKEINHRYREAAAKQRRPSPMVLAAHESDPFCKRLQQQLPLGRLDSRKVKCIDKIKSVIGEIDAIIQGKETIKSKADGKSTSRTINEEVVPVRQVISQSKWSYETPSRQKLRRPVSVCYNSSVGEIKPCLLQIQYTKSKVPFELNPTVGNLTTIDNMATFSDLSLPLGANAWLFRENVGAVERRGSPFHVQRHRWAKNNPGLSSFGNVTRQDPTLMPFNRQPDVNDWQHRRKESTSFERNFAPGYDDLSPLKLPFGGALADLRQFDDEPKENYRARDLSNRPRRGEFRAEQHFVMDEQLLQPTFPDLNEAIAPLKFYPRKL